MTGALAGRGRPTLTRPAGGDMVLDDSDWSHKAWMSKVDADLLEQIIDRRSRAALGCFDVLEWGAGRSTLYFTERLQAAGVGYRWVSLEYDRGYFLSDLAPKLNGLPGVQTVFVEEGASLPLTGLPQADQPLTVVVFDKGKLSPFMADHAADRAVNMDAYVDLPSRLGRKFDFIFVDGRKRRRCLLEAARLLKPGGVAVLHDAYRPYYQCAFMQFAAQQPIGEILWIGSAEPADLSRWLD
jgi:SAM-dependent methyltransferase